MRSSVPMNNASNVIATNCEKHRLKKSQEVHLFIQRLVYMRRSTIRLFCSCFVLTDLSEVTAVFSNSHLMRGHGEAGRRRMRSHMSTATGNLLSSVLLPA